MVNSKRKGKEGELEACRFIRQFGYDAERGVQYKGSPGSPDIVSEDLGEFHIEVKRTNSFSPYKALEQAERDRGRFKIPLVLHRRDQHQWIAVMNAEDFMYYISGVTDFKDWMAKRKEDCEDGD